MRGLSLVGWYHSHPRGPALPSLQDIDSQMDHQLRLQGSNNGFQPCLGVICGQCWASRPLQDSGISTLAAGRHQAALEMSFVRQRHDLALVGFDWHFRDTDILHRSHSFFYLNLNLDCLVSRSLLSWQPRCCFNYYTVLGRAAT